MANKSSQGDLPRLSNEATTVLRGYFHDTLHPEFEELNNALLQRFDTDFGLKISGLEDGIETLRKSLKSVEAVREALREENESQKRARENLLSIAEGIKGELGGMKLSNKSSADEFKSSLKSLSEERSKLIDDLTRKLKAATDDVVTRHEGLAKGVSALAEDIRRSSKDVGETIVQGNSETQKNLAEILVHHSSDIELIKTTLEANRKTLEKSASDSSQTVQLARSMSESVSKEYAKRERDILKRMDAIEDSAGKSKSVSVFLGVGLGALAILNAIALIVGLGT